MSHHVGALVTETVDHGNDVTSTLRLIVQRRIGRLIAQAVTERIDADYTVAVGKCIDHATLLPARCIEQQAVLQHDQRPGALNGVMDALAPMIGEWHFIVPHVSPTGERGDGPIQDLVPD